MKTINELKKIVRILILILLIIVIIYGFVFVFLNKKDNDDELSTINGYTLYKRDGDLYKSIFNELKVELEGEVDYKKYAEDISRLFIIDLYTLDNKDGENDVSAVQYIYEDAKDNFITYVSDTLYRNIKTLKELPVVKEINVDKVEESSYKINDTEYNSFVVYLSWTYDKDYGYDNSKVLTLIKTDNKLSIVEMGDIVEQ